MLVLIDLLLWLVVFVKLFVVDVEIMTSGWFTNICVVTFVGALGFLLFAAISLYSGPEIWTNNHHNNASLTLFFDNHRCLPSISAFRGVWFFDWVVIWHGVLCGNQPWYHYNTTNKHIHQPYPNLTWSPLNNPLKGSFLPTTEVHRSFTIQFQYIHDQVAVSPQYYEWSPQNLCSFMSFSASFRGEWSIFVNRLQTKFQMVVHYSKPSNTQEKTVLTTVMYNTLTICFSSGYRIWKTSSRKYKSFDEDILLPIPHRRSPLYEPIIHRSKSDIQTIFKEGMRRRRPRKLWRNTNDDRR